MYIYRKKSWIFSEIIKSYIYTYKKTTKKLGTIVFTLHGWINLVIPQTPYHTSMLVRRCDSSERGCQLCRPTRWERVIINIKAKVIDWVGYSLFLLFSPNTQREISSKWMLCGCCHQTRRVLCSRFRWLEGEFCRWLTMVMLDARIPMRLYHNIFVYLICANNQ